MFRGKRLRSQTKEVVLNVYRYFEKQAKKGKICCSSLERTSKATGLSRSAVSCLRGEKEALGEDEEFSTPKKRYCSSRRRVDPDDFNREAIRRLVYRLYENTTNLTLCKLLVSNRT